ncbi:citrate transporter [Luteibacter aegosomaticola]|uniref:SLC13 family permease n=1 Tax=Luteibacter aegosomaticola TaxID=2911538 RepID=UPI001FFB962E|nr:SLC13 family permease [Luteibacter aegosomaticola]UPG89179.1 citrate transporter [Luteibacter aegosomaticola]
MIRSYPERISWMTWLPESLRNLRRDVFFLVLLGVAILFAVAMPSRVSSWPALVDWPTIAALTGLLILTKAVEESGALAHAGRWLIDRTSTRRLAALGLVAATALLSMLLTNDVSLFVMVPLTLSMCRIARMPAMRLVIFEALAVNAGSMLTPIGNPQNLFLWQQWGIGFGGFVWAMLPVVAIALVLLLALTAVAFPATRLEVHEHVKNGLDRTMLVVAAVLYLPFLVLADLHYVAWGLVGVFVVFAVFRPRILAAIDWGLLLTFVLMFIDLRMLAGLDVVKSALGALDLQQPLHLFGAGAVASQVVSNVPAAILLAEYSHDWRTLAWAVNVGGFGFILGSLANLIALRLLGEKKAWATFHLWSVPFFLVMATISALLL